MNEMISFIVFHAFSPRIIVAPGYRFFNKRSVEFPDWSAIHLQIPAWWGPSIRYVIAGVFSEILKSKTSPFLLIGSARSIFLGGAALQVLKGSMEIYIVLLMGCSLMLVLSTLIQIQVMTYLQILTPKELTGKVISCVMCIVCVRILLDSSPMVLCLKR